MKTIEGIEKNKFRYVLRIFILKLIRIKAKDYESFLQFDFSKLQIEFINNKEEFNFDEKIENTLDYMFITINNAEMFDKAFQKFSIEKEYFISLIKEQKDGFDIFICLLINLFASKYTKENYIQNNKKILDNLSNWIIEILNNIQCSDIFKEYIKLLTNPDKFLQSFLPHIKNISMNEYEIFLYSFRLISNCLLSEDNHFYKNLLSPNIINYIKENYIPGDEPNDNLLINSAKEIEKFLQNTPDVGNYMPAAYVCSCGQWYHVARCGFPTAESICFVCKQKIGGIEYQPIDREGHYRIFKNESQQTSVMNHVKNWLKNKVFRHKTLQTFEKEIEDIINQVNKGFKKVNLDFFIDENKIIRKGLNQISYRFLSFIFFSYLFYAKILGYIDENTIKNNFLPNNSKSLNDIIFIIWKLLEKALKAKGINEIQIFLNLIYPKII